MKRDMERDKVGYEIVAQTAEKMIQQFQSLIRSHENRIRIHKESILALRADIELKESKKYRALEALGALEALEESDAQSSRVY